MQILDCAVLVISATDGVQAHTLTLWRLLERYSVPVMLFINKMDLPGADRETLMAQLRQKLSPCCVDFGTDEDTRNESAAMCDEALLESYLESGTVTDGNLRGLIGSRKLFPCCFGAALQLDGVDELLDTICAYAPHREYGGEFGALVYKIARDPQGNRLTYLKLTGGTLKVRDTLRYTDRSRKVIRFGFVIVDDSRRGQGHGRAMLSLAARFAFDIFGAEKVTLGVFAHNEPAYRCYKAVGFTETGLDYDCEISGQPWRIIEMALEK